MPKLLTYKYNGTQYLGATHEVLINNIINDVRNNFTGQKSTPELKQLKAKILLRAKPYDTGSHKEYIPPQPNRKKLTLGEAVTGATAFVRAATGDHVGQDEINRRAGICSTGANGGACPKLSQVSNCRSCGGFSSMLASWVGKVKAQFGMKHFTVPNMLEDDYCSCCGCALAVMLPSHTDAFDMRHDKQNDRPAFCWIKQGGSNYKEI